MEPLRLNPATLPNGVREPRYERAALQTGIVHLGIGAFMRAHLAVVNEDALDAGGSLGWGITGVSLRAPATRDALAPQGGLYTLSLRDAAGESLRIIGCVRECSVATEDPDTVVRLIAAPGTRIVSLTVTEKGYLDEGPGSAAAFIVAGLAQRRAAGHGPLTLMSLDNLPSNGIVLRRRVLALAERGDPDLARWIAARCTFPNSMVDRIVPRTTDADRERITAALGVRDAWPVVGEPFFDWAVEDRFADGRPDWPGVRFVADAGPFERRKLRMVNGAHSTIAYLSLAAGWATVDEAMRQPALRRHVDALLRDEVEPTLAGVDLDGYRARLLERFANPALAHRCAQIAMDGSQKMPQRILDTVRDRLRTGGTIDRLALTVAAWWWHQNAPGADDPLAAELQAHWQRSGGGRAGAGGTDAVRLASSLTHFQPVFGDLAGAAALVAALAPHLRSLAERGPLATLESLP